MSELPHTRYAKAGDLSIACQVAGERRANEHMIEDYCPAAR
jgi:hypothetical protein